MGISIGFGSHLFDMIDMNVVSREVEWVGQDEGDQNRDGDYYSSESLTSRHWVVVCGGGRWRWWL